MDQPEAEGIRILSFDGGDIRAMSQLLILDEFMRRVEWDRNSTIRILPCDYFHMMGGAGAGGIIAMLLVTLRMGIEEATEEFINIWTTVFANVSLDQVARSSKLEMTIKDLLEQRGLPGDRRMYNGDGEDTSCKAFVCAVPESNLGMCEKFRSYKSEETSSNPTIVEAIRATCAIPTLFTPVSIESVGCQVSYVTGAYNFNNPAWETIKEACETFGSSKLVACMLSLGCGQRPTARLSQKNEAGMASLVNDIASDSELVDRDLAWRIGKSNIYYRFSVDRILESSGDSSRGSIGDITAFTKVFLEHPTTAEKVNQCTKVSERLGRVTLTDISGLSEPKPATAHGLPSLSAFFVERPGLIKQMAQCLFRVGPPAQRIIVLSGLGGIGKTQITVSFLHQFLSRFRHVLFIDGSSVQSIESGIVAKVKSLGLTYVRTSAGEALEVLANPDHEITRDWAIVYDNVDNRDINIADYFPRCSFGTIFITTRNRNLGNLAPNAHLKLDIMSEEEAADVLLRSAFDPSHLIMDTDEQHAREIAKELGYLPVALVQAGYFIKIHNCIHDYRQRLRKRRPDILSRPAQDQLNPHYHGVYASLNVTWPHLSTRAQNFMSILGFVNYTGLPLILLYRAATRGFLFEPHALMDRSALFQQIIQLLYATFRPEEESDTQDIDDLVAELERYSLVTRTVTFMVTTLRLHPLVHSWTHDRLPKEDRDTYRAAAIRVLVCGTDSDDQDIYEFIYPHVTLMLDGLADLHVNDQAGLAAVLAHQGDIKTAIELWEGIQRKVLILYGRDDLRSGEADLQLALIYRRTTDQEKLDLASLSENEVVAIRKRTLGSEHPMTMKAIVQLASGMKHDGKRDNAATILRDALEFWERQPGDHWEAILRIKEELIGCYSKGEAINLRTEVLQARIQRSGPDHHATLKAMKNLARAYDDRGWYTDAETKDVSATDIWISVVAARTDKRGIEHPDTLNAMEGLAWSYSQEYSQNEAVAHWEKVVEMRKAVQGACHPDTLSTMGRLESCYNFVASPAKQKQKGKELREEIVHLREEIVCLSKESQGPSHKDTFSAMKVLARTCVGWKKYTRAEELWKEILWLTREVQHPSHKDTIEAMKELAKLYEAWGKYAESEDQWKGMVLLTKRAHGPNHQGTLQAMRDLANLYRLWKKYTESEAQWKEVVQFTKEARGPNHNDVLNAMKELANVYTDWGKYTEGEGQWEEILRLTRELWGSNHKSTLCAMKEVAGMNEKWGKYTEAEKKWKEIVRLTREACGPDHEDTLRTMTELAWLYEKWTRIKKLKRYPELEEMWEEIIRLTRGALGPSNRDTVHAMNTLARIYKQWCNYTKAEELWKEIARLKSDVQGPSHETIIGALAGLAALNQKRRNYAESENQWKEIVQLKKRSKGCNRWSIPFYIGELAGLYESCGRYTEAILQLEESLRFKEDAKDLYSSTICYNMGCLARLYERVGRYDEAVLQWEEILQFRKDKEEEDSTDWHILHCMGELAGVYERCEQYTKAAAQRQEIVQLNKEAHGLTHQDTLDAIAQLAKICDSAEAYTEWEAQVKEDVRLTREAKSPSHEDTIEAMGRLAGLYMAWKKYAEAEDQWEKIIRLTKEARGPGSLGTVKAMTGLANLYEAWGNYAEAEDQWKEILRLIKEARGLGSLDAIEAMTRLANLYEAWSKYIEAEDQWKEIILLTKEARGLDSLDTIKAMKGLSGMYEACERHTDAIAQLEEIVQLTTDDESLESYEETVTHIKSLAEKYMKFERYEDAETLLLDAIDRARRDGEGNWSTQLIGPLLEEVRSRPTRVNDTSSTT